MDLSSLNLIELVPSNLLILVSVLYVLGAGLKKLLTVQDKHITLILLVLGITLAILLAIINAQYNTILEAVINGLIQGIICWGLQLELIKQLNN